MTKEDLISIGFKEIPHYTVMGSLIFDLGRNRDLSVGCVGSPNEMIYICETSDNDSLGRDVVIIRNYDYDGYTTIEEVKTIIKAISPPKSLNEKEKTGTDVTEISEPHGRELALKHMIEKHGKYEDSQLSLCDYSSITDRCFDDFKAGFNKALSLSKEGEEEKKPLSAISDADATEVAKIEGLVNAKIHRQGTLIMMSDDTYELRIDSVVKEMVLLKNGTLHPMNKEYKCWQYLQSKNYETPKYY
jgi:hypothetical protein